MGPARGRGPVGVVGLAAAALAVAGILVAVNRDPGDHRGPTIAAGGSTSTSTSSSSTSSVPTTGLPATSTTVASPTTTRRGATTTAPSTTVARRTTVAPPTTLAPAPASTTTTRPPGPQCTSAQVEVRVATDKPVYGSGETVTASVTLRNRSAATCFFTGYSLTGEFLDGSGKMVTGFGVINDPLPGVDAPLAPGQTIRHDGPWNQRLCGDLTCIPAPTGTYTVSSRWAFAGVTYLATTTFILA